MNVHIAQPKSTKAKRGAPIVSILRELLLSGEFKPGQRLTEAFLSERLGVSRTPIRQALPILERDRLIEPSGLSYVVREVPQSEMLEVIEIRGLLESAALKSIAEDGISKSVLAELKRIVAVMDDVLAKGFISIDDFHPFHETNEQFHAVIIDAARRPVLTDLIERMAHGRRAEASMAFDETRLISVYQYWCVGQHQHRTMVQAMANGDGTRAAAIAREHVTLQQEALTEFTQEI